MSDETEIRGVIPNYYAFIIDKLNRIADAEINYNYPLALHIALDLSKFLPRKLKKQLAPEKERIEKGLKNLSSSGYFHNSIHRQLNQLERKYAANEEPPFVDALTTLLDQEHLLTQTYGVPTRQGSLKQIGEQLS